MMLRPTLLWLVLSFLALSWNHGEARAQDSLDTGSHLFQSHWTGSVLGRTQSGELCWVTGPEGALRLEILFPVVRPADAPTAPNLLSDLLQQRGQGYCLVLGEGADGTFNPWGEPWQRLDAVVARWLIPVARLVSGHPESPAASFPPWREVTSATRDREFMFSPGRKISVGPAARTWQAELPTLKRVLEEPATPSVATTFRRDSVGRGMGRGGSAEILRLTLSSGSPGSWTLTTSRKPGRLELSIPLRHAIQRPGLEVFAPLWPLADVLVFDDK